MEPTAPLQLRDIHLPDAVSWWPPAPGWWMLLTAIVGLGALVTFLLWVKKQRRLRVAALKAFKGISSDFEQDGNVLKLTQQLSILLRRICLSAFPRRDVASLTGESWLTFLDDCLDWQKSEDRFSRGAGRALISAPYQVGNTEYFHSLDTKALLRICAIWIDALPRSKGSKA